MHACGHDVHIATFIGDGARAGETEGPDGTARSSSSRQPAEEIGDWGARRC